MFYLNNVLRDLILYGRRILMTNSIQSVVYNPLFITSNEDTFIRDFL